MKADFERVKTIVVHGDCPDGLASAMVLHDVLPDAEVRFMRHGNADYENMPADPGLLFCDIIPPIKRVQEFVDAGAIVLDHHKGVRAAVELFGERGVFGDEKTQPGVSGAVLAFHEVWKELESASKTKTETIDEFVALIGIVDTWQKKDSRWNEARACSSALSAFSTDYWMEHCPYPTSGEIKMGENLIEKHDERVRRIADGAYLFRCGGYNYAVFPGSSYYTSFASDVLREEKDVDVMAGFSFYTRHFTEKEKESLELKARTIGKALGISVDSTMVIPRIAFSIRTGERADAAAFAQIFEGNGHSRAAGSTSFRKT